jgi:hypothetical protein
MLVDVMGRDDRIAGVMRTRVQGLLGLPMTFEAKDGPARAKTVAKDLEERWLGDVPRDRGRRTSSGGASGSAWGPGELLWETSASRWT